jgi:hypothetical protein
LVAKRWYRQGRLIKENQTMARHDIVPHQSEHGGHARLLHFPAGAGTTESIHDTSFRAGEVLEITAASGDIDCTPDGAADPGTGLVYISATDSQGLVRGFGGPQAAAGDADGELVAVYAWNDGQEFETDNAYAGDDTNIGPAGSGAMTGVTIGATVGLWRTAQTAAGTPGEINGDFGVDTGGTTCIITQILDALGRPTSVSGADPATIVFKLIS